MCDLGYATSPVSTSHLPWPHPVTHRRAHIELLRRRRGYFLREAPSLSSPSSSCSSLPSDAPPPLPALALSDDDDDGKGGEEEEEDDDDEESLPSVNAPPLLPSAGSNTMSYTSRAWLSREGVPRALSTGARTRRTPGPHTCDRCLALLGGGRGRPPRPPRPPRPARRTNDNDKRRADTAALQTPSQGRWGHNCDPPQKQRTRTGVNKSWRKSSGAAGGRGFTATARPFIALRDG